MIEFDYRPDEYCGICDQEHKLHFSNYLCRTDKGQKWTNENTNFNLYMIPDENGELILYTADSLEKRLLLRDMILEKLKDCPIENMLNDVGEMYYNEDIEDEMLEAIFLDYIDYMEMVWEIAKHANDFMEKSICFVMHCDQTNRGLHIHRFYII